MGSNDFSSNKNEWIWEPLQRVPFETIKKKLILSPQLAFYNLNLYKHASSYGLSGVLLELQDDKKSEVERN